jgi:hypothetical protein
MVYTPVSENEFVIPLDLGVTPEPSAPSPVLLCGRTTFLVFYTNPYTSSETPESGRREEVAVVEWKLCTAAVLGYPNEEAIEGHRLWARGMEELYHRAPYIDCFEVINSSWVAAMERANRVHPDHNPSLFAHDRHFIVSFRDETFECVAHKFRARRSRKPRKQVLKKLIRQL